MACPKNVSVTNRSFLEWKGWAFLTFLIVLLDTGYYGIVNLKKWLDGL